MSVTRIVNRKTVMMPRKVGVTACLGGKSAPRAELTEIGITCLMVTMSRALSRSTPVTLTSRGFYVMYRSGTISRHVLQILPLDAILRWPRCRFRGG